MSYAKAHWFKPSNPDLQYNVGRYRERRFSFYTVLNIKIKNLLKIILSTTVQRGKDKLSVMDKRDLCNYRKASQFREVADIAYFTIYTSDSD